MRAKKWTIMKRKKQKQVKENLQNGGIDESSTMEEEIPIWDDCEHKQITWKEDGVTSLKTKEAKWK